MRATIWHNPGCSTSRKVLAALREAGCEVEVVEYLKAGWTAEGLRELFAAAGMTALQALRVKGGLAGERGLLQPGVGEEALIAAMVAHPVLVERPFVRTDRGAALCRPVEVLEPLLGRGCN